MTRILITGGTGVFGNAILPFLKDYTVRIFSRSSRKSEYDDSIEWAQGQIATGDGIAEAMQDVDIIIHAASSPFNPQGVDVEGTRILLQEAEKASIQHFIYLSIVGINRIPMAYYKAKYAAEQIIEAGNVPYTILRATQFHELMLKLFLLPVVKIPFIAPLAKDFKFQLIDKRDVAVRVAEIVAAGASGRVPDIGGPKIQTLDEIAQAWLHATDKRRILLNLPLFGETAKGFRNAYNSVPENRYGKITWQQWLDETYDKRASQQATTAKDMRDEQ